MKKLICCFCIAALACCFSVPVFAEDASSSEAASYSAASSDSEESIDLDTGGLLDDARNSLDAYGSGFDDAMSSAQSGIPVDDSNDPDLHLFAFPALMTALFAYILPSWFTVYLIFFALAITAFAVYKSLGKGD